MFQKKKKKPAFSYRLCLLLLYMSGRTYSLIFAKLFMEIISTQKSIGSKSPKEIFCYIFYFYCTIKSFTMKKLNYFRNISIIKEHIHIWSKINKLLSQSQLLFQLKYFSFCLQQQAVLTQSVLFTRIYSQKDTIHHAISGLFSIVNTNFLL